MKGKKGFWLGLSALVILAACEHDRTTEACLVNGSPECTNLGGYGGDAGGPNTTPCTQHPDFGDACDNGTGIYVCAPNGVDLICSHKPDGGGGHGGDGGPFNCATHPDNGDPCKTVDGKDGKWGCNWNGTALICHPNGGGSGGDGGGGGSPPYNCATDPELGSPCSVPGGGTGVKVCAPSGTGLVCHCTSGCGGSGGGDGGGGSGGVYNCATDPQLGSPCYPGVGECQNTGIRICNLAGDGLACSVGPKPAPSATDICGNGKDDNCNGSVDEPGCTGGGGTGGDGGGGSGGDGGGGSGGSGGGATCTIAPVNTMVQGQTSLVTLLKGMGSVNSTNPQNFNFNNGDQLSLAAGTSVSISVFTPAAKLNYWEPYTGGGGDPMPLIDALFCRQLGINPPTPASCNASVIGDRKSAAYLSSLRIDWECWRKGGAFCPSTITGYVPGDLFTLKKIVQNGDGISSLAGVKWGVLETPPACP